MADEYLHQRQIKEKWMKDYLEEINLKNKRKQDEVSLIKYLKLF